MRVNRREVLGIGMAALVTPSMFLAETPRNPTEDSAPPRDVESPAGLSADSLATSSARAVLRRTLGNRADEIKLEWIPAVDRHPVYEYSCSKGVLTVKGSSGVALARGAYAYLREHGNAMVTWSGRNIQLPVTFPDAQPTRVVSPYEFVEYLNPCTFGYSTPFWNWERWERELDWMALHGISMPLALNGQEAIWREVWASFGVTAEEFGRFTVGPAHLPWHWMGNINQFQGPLPSGWIDDRTQLQKRLLRRMRELGMSPIGPAFAGYVPEAFLRIYPHAKISTLLWSPSQQKSMPRQTKTFLLHPAEEELFKEVGRRFIQAYSKVYGELAYFLADPFNEMDPPVSINDRYSELAQYGRVLYESIQAGDPHATWVMQGWLFASGTFWDKKSTQAFLSAIPNEKMIILDFANDRDQDMARNEWKRLDSFYGKRWMNGMAHTFGGNNNVKGNLPLIARQPTQVLEDFNHGNLVGWAMMMEGIETNEACYELMTDIGWSNLRIDLDEWIPKYCRARYGDCPEVMREAWSGLLHTAYSAGAYHSKHAFQRRPSLTPESLNVDDGTGFVAATEKFLACAPALAGNALYRNDLIELAGQAIGGRIDNRLLAACKAHSDERNADRDRYAKEALDMLLRLDAIVNLREDRRLETWTNAARSFAKAPDEAAYYESNARLLLTFWGWSELNDYAARVWSGLIRDYYRMRWQLFFKTLSTGDAPEDAIERWEQAWISTPYRASQPLVVRDLVASAQNMLADSRSWI